MKLNGLKFNTFPKKTKLTKFFEIGLKEEGKESKNITVIKMPHIGEKKAKVSFKYFNENELNTKRSYKKSKEELAGLVQIIKPFNLNKNKKKSEPFSIYNKMIESIKEKLAMEENQISGNRLNKITKDNVTFNNKMINSSILSLQIPKSKRNNNSNDFISKRDHSESVNLVNFSANHSVQAAEPSPNIGKQIISPKNQKIGQLKRNGFFREVMYPDKNTSSFSSCYEEYNNKEIKMMFKRKNIFVEKYEPYNLPSCNRSTTITANSAIES
jgi:hypothetical protein